MNSRPVSVTVIASIIIVTSAIGLVFSLFLINHPTVQELMAKSPLPVPVQYALEFVAPLLSALCGVFMLKGANWARLLYVGWRVLILIITFITMPVNLATLFGVIFLAVVVFFLFRPKANAFFSRHPNSDVTT